MIKKISVDRNLCIGAASCVTFTGTVFELDAENKAIIIQKNSVKNSGPAEKGALANEAILDDDLLMAAQSCPTKAIFLFDENNKQVYPVT